MAKLWSTAVITVSTFWLAACGGGGGDSSPATTVTTRQAVSIQFAAQANGSPVKCGSTNTIAHLGSTDKTAELQDLRFYVSNVKLINNKGEEVAVSLDKNDWQNYGVALLDFEDGTGACANNGSGTAAMNTVLTGNVASGVYTGIHFTLGVPDVGVDDKNKTLALNHNDTALLGAPLDVPALGWMWQVGHKFLKLEVQPQGKVTNADSTTSDSWYVHLGGTDCKEAAAGDPAIYSCSNLNLGDVKLAAFNADSQQVVFDVAALLANADLSKNQNGMAGCMSDTSDKDCPAIFNALRISMATGKPVAGAPVVFKAVSK